MTRSPSAPLWVLTTYYNPVGYLRRRLNFKAFRRLLNAPLLAVELTRDGRHELSDDDAEILIRLTGEDRLWQKERLLNLGLAALPRHVEFVAWIDCDLIFVDDQWAAKAVKRLEKNGGMLQLFDWSHHLPREADPQTLSAAACKDFAPLFSGVAVARALRDATFGDNELRLTKARDAPDLDSRHRIIDGHNCYGMAWAAPRATIEACGHYDRFIVGGGDSTHVYAALSRLDDLWRLRPHSDGQRRDVASWAIKAAEVGLTARLDSLDADAYHMWHGDVANRNYRGRYEILARHNFDSRRDIALASNGAWRWTDPEGELAREVGAYFWARREDGEG